MKRGSTTHIGRALGFPSGPSSSDRTVSRRHLSLRHDEFELQFEVIGRNPIVVRSANGGGDRVYRNSEKGELKRGDRVSLSLKTPFFWVVRRVGGRGEEGEVDRAVLDAVERREKRTLERRRRREEEEAARAPIYGGEVDDEVFNAALESDLAHLDLPQIDPVQEFGFIVMGHEFDNYPKQKLRPMKSWNWYLEEPREKNSDEEEGAAANDEAVTLKGKSKNRRRKNSGKEGEDEDWMGESEDEEEFISKSGSAKRSKYSTRSKDPKKPRSDSMQRKGVMGYKDGEYGEGEEDETLGGFIVDNDDEEEATLDEEEEEFDEEYDGDDDND
ncbi:hypothetical protein ACMD2_04596 [Ananas comosus]|nr:hypothetical protein ACMD2_04596 [Ananas comosus]